MLTRDEFFALAPPIRTQDVEVPGTGVVRVRMMTAGERGLFESAMQGKAITDIRAGIVVASVVDDDGKHVFTYADVPRISAMPAAVVEPIFDAVIKLNKISASDIEELEKN